MSILVEPKKPAEASLIFFSQDTLPEFGWSDNGMNRIWNKIEFVVKMIEKLE